VWEDDNCDGVQDGGEGDRHSVLLTLYRAGETTPLMSAISDGDGLYEFEVARNTGDYYVVAELPSGYVFSPGNQQPPATADTDSDIESYFVDGSGNVDLTRGSSWNIPSDKNHLHVDVGLCPVTDTITTGDYVWEDTDCDGYQDSSESGLPGVTMHLYRSGELDNPYLTTVSDANGNYFFEVGKDSGNYYLAAELPSGYMFSPGDVANANDDSDIVGYVIDGSGNVDYTQGRTGYSNAESSGDSWNRGDVGLCPDTNKGTIGDYVWQDTDGDGIQDGGESGWAGITVVLFCEEHSDWCFDTQTDANGAYHFDVWPGQDYEVWFMLPNDPDDYEFTMSSSPASNSDNSDIEYEIMTWDWGVTDEISVGAGGGDYTDYADAGIYDK
jgi:hypothetical protein